jgi:hypothetical protein
LTPSQKTTVSSRQSTSQDLPLDYIIYGSKLTGLETGFLNLAASCKGVMCAERSGGSHLQCTRPSLACGVLDVKHDHHEQEQAHKSLPPHTLYVDSADYTDMQNDMIRSCVVNRLRNPACALRCCVFTLSSCGIWAPHGLEVWSAHPTCTGMMEYAMSHHIQLSRALISSQGKGLSFA